MKDNLKAFVEAINASPSSLRRIEGEYRVQGNSGHVYYGAGPVGESGPYGFWAYCTAASPRAWTYAKRALSAWRVINDGDDEGLMFLPRLPTADEGEQVRAYLGIRKRMEMSDERLAALREQAQRMASMRAENPPRKLTEAA